jgi:hypothetical protein
VLLRAVPDRPAEEVLKPAADLWRLHGDIVYLADQVSEAGRTLLALRLPQAMAVPLSRVPVSAYRPLFDDGLLFVSTSGTSIWMPAWKEPLRLGADIRQALTVSGGRFLVLQGTGQGRAGTLRLLRPDGQPDGMMPLDEQVELCDTLEREPDGRVAVYAISRASDPKKAGLWRRPLP